MHRIIFIRHAEVDLDPSKPSSEWPLKETANESVIRLVSQSAWDGVVRIYHSPEVKAVATAEIVSQWTGIECRGCPDLREVEMGVGFLSREKFLQKVANYLAMVPDPDCEPYTQAEARIVGAMKALIPKCGSHSLAVVSHGRILSLLFGYLFARPVTLNEWQGIGTPDLAVLHLADGRVESGFFAGARLARGLGAIE